MMRRLGKTCFAVATAVMVATVSRSEPSSTPVTSFGKSFKQSGAKLSKNTKSMRINKPFPEDPPRYYRLRIRVENPQREAWTMSVRSPAGQILSTFDETATGCEDQDGCWTIRLTSALPTLNFATDSDLVKAEFISGQYMPHEAKHPFYSPMPNSTDEKLSSMSLANPDDMKELYRLADGLGLFIGSGNTATGAEANWCCSGIQLTKDLFMTNWHCGAPSGMDDAAFWPVAADGASAEGNVCKVGIVDMSWDDDNIGREYACEKVEYANKKIDVAILRLGTLADGPALSRPLSPPVLSTQAVDAGQPITILHHPACKPKSVTRGCTVLKKAVKSWTGDDSDGGSEFTHNCTTEAGSSGGAVFSLDAKLVGLHHLGENQTRGEIGNLAVSMTAILDAIAEDNLALSNEIVNRAP